MRRRSLFLLLLFRFNQRKSGIAALEMFRWDRVLYRSQLADNILSLAGSLKNAPGL